MAVMTIAYALAAVFMIYAVITFLFGNKNKTPVIFELYEAQGGQLIRQFPTKKLKAFIKEEKGIHQLYLPKRLTYGKLKGIEVPAGEDYISNSAGVRLIKIVRVGEGEFKLMKIGMRLASKDYVGDYKVIDRDIQFWGYNEQERVRQDYQVESMWDKIRPLVMLSVVALAAIIIMYMAFDKAESISKSSYEETEKTRNWIENLVSDPEKITNNINNKDQGNIDTNADRPPSSG